MGKVQVRSRSDFLELDSEVGQLVIKLKRVTLLKSLLSTLA